MSSVDDQAQLGGRKGVVSRAWQPKELLQTEQANNTIFLNAETITMSLIIPQFFLLITARHLVMAAQERGQKTQHLDDNI